MQENIVLVEEKKRKRKTALRNRKKTAEILLTICHFSMTKHERELVPARPPIAKRGW
jgi:hypothetical protein